MLKKMLLVFAVAGLAVASAKTYTIVISNPSTVGTALLRPGEYRVLLQGSKVVFRNDENRQVAEANAKIVNEDKKFEQTAIETKTVAGKTTIENIRLGGTKTEVLLNN
jgi:hypothetical protein